MKKNKKQKHMKNVFYLFIVFGLILNMFPIEVLAQENEVVQDAMQEDAVASQSVKASQIISQDTTWNDKVELSENLIVNRGVTLTINDQITINGDVSISGGGIIRRSNDYYGVVIEIPQNSKLRLENIIFDGDVVYGEYNEATLTGDTKLKPLAEFLGYDFTQRSGKDGTALLIDVNGGNLIMDEGTILKNNATSADARINYYSAYPNTCNGVGIRAGGNFIMNGGVITDMYGSSVASTKDVGNRFVMNGGKITHSYGLAIIVNENSEMTMNGGEVSYYAREQNNAIGIRGNNSKFTMNGGEISYNFGSAGNYGTIMATNGNNQTVNLLGGKIHNNKGSYGTAIVTYNNTKTHIGGNVEIYNNGPGTTATTNCIWIADNGTLLVDGNANIHDNVASPTVLCDGQCVFAGNAKIENNSSTNSPAVTIKDGELTMKDNVSVSNNVSEGMNGAGAGIKVGEGSTLTVLGGSITNNKMYKTSGGYDRGAGVYLEKTTSILNIGGDTTISGNEVYLVDGDGKVIEGSDIAEVDIDLWDNRILNIVSSLTTDGYIGIFSSKEIADGTILIKGNDSYTLSESDLEKIKYKTEIGNNLDKAMYLDPTSNTFKSTDGWKITFDPNDGTNNSFDRNYPKTIKTTLSKNKFVKEGYIFKGWNTKADGTGTPYADGAEVLFHQNMTVYAQWIELKTDDISMKYSEEKSLDEIKINGVKFENWKSNDESIVKIEDGKIKAVGIGKTTIVSDAKLRSNETLSVNVEVTPMPIIYGGATKPNITYSLKNGFAPKINEVLDLFQAEKNSNGTYTPLESAPINLSDDDVEFIYKSSTGQTVITNTLPIIKSNDAIEVKMRLKTSKYRFYTIGTNWQEGTTITLLVDILEGNKKESSLYLNGEPLKDIGSTEDKDHFGYTGEAIIPITDGLTKLSAKDNQVEVFTVHFHSVSEGTPSYEGHLRGTADQLTKEAILKIAPKEIGVYAMIINGESDTHYVSASRRFAIVKGTPVGEPIFDRVASEVNLSSVSLRGTMVNEAGIEVEGAFTWNTPDVQVSKGMAYSWTFTPIDLEHYDIVNGKSVVWEEEKRPEIPVGPEVPEKPVESNKADTPNTGDMTNLQGLISMLICSSGVLAVLLEKRRKKTINMMKR
ncbi:MAG: hypothetical protein HFE68_06225 [Erysipelotrichaceae bacterium]|nr:hypothetical protein [Erysipelotrichaceae bacterium]